MLVWLTLPFYNFCGFRSVAVNSVYKLQFFYIYISMVRPHLEFGNVVWHPILKKDQEILESVQRRATKLVPSLSKLCYEERLKLMHLPSLSYRRLRGDVIETFKHLHGIYNTNSSTLLPLAPLHAGIQTRGHSLKLLKRECRLSVRGWANVLGFRIVNFWNSMSEDIVTAPTVNILKGRFDKKYAHLHYSSNIDYFTVWETGLQVLWPTWIERWWWCIILWTSLG